MVSIQDCSKTCCIVRILDMSSEESPRKEFGCCKNESVGQDRCVKSQSWTEQ